MPSALLDVAPLGFPWKTVDPFLFCVHHEDFYPAGNGAFGPAASLAGRDLGMDFTGRDGWRMYHGERVPGFPPHPHRGFETVTVARRGFIDHADSLGAKARFGRGDLQWMTAGRGIVHSEMFPLLDGDGPNDLELFQIWLNLPAEDKMVEPHFAMLWDRTIPRVERAGAELRIFAGRFEDAVAPAPPPRSWAARASSDVAIWTLKLAPEARVTLPPAATARTRRTVYFFRGEGLRVDGEPLPGHRAAEVRSDRSLPLAAEGDQDVEVLVLQGRPIGEPVAHHGPFVMNSREELRQAFVDYQRTQFGGWPWDDQEPVHGPDAVRFARHADGKEERADG